MPENEKLWLYISKLENAIRKTMESSDEIAGLVSKIQAEGIHVTLNFLALFFDPDGNPFFLKGTDAKGDEQLGFSTLEETTDFSAPVDFKLTDDDHDFLKDIGIRFDE